jgi:hypothetical protein
MNEFEELDVPKQANLGWYIVSLWGPVHYLHDDGMIHIGTEDSFYTSSGYFETELEAHKSAERYYLTHGRKYPYTTLLNAAYKQQADSSQVMDFG